MKVFPSSRSAGDIPYSILDHQPQQPYLWTTAGPFDSRYLVSPRATLHSNGEGRQSNPRDMMWVCLGRVTTIRRGVCGQPVSSNDAGEEPMVNADPTLVYSTESAALRWL